MVNIGFCLNLNFTPLPVLICHAMCAGRTTMPPPRPTRRVVTIAALHSRAAGLAIRFHFKFDLDNVCARTLLQHF